MKVVLKKIYNHNMRGDYEVSTRFFVLTKNGREIEVEYLANAFFPETNEEFQTELFTGYSGRRSEETYEAEKDFSLNKPVDLKNAGLNYTYRYLELLDVYFHDWEYMDQDIREVFTAEISPQALRVLVEPWKYGIDRRSVRRGF